MDEQDEGAQADEDEFMAVVQKKAKHQKQKVHKKAKKQSKKNLFDNLENEADQEQTIQALEKDTAGMENEKLEEPIVLNTPKSVPKATQRKGDDRYKQVSTEYDLDWTAESEENKYNLIDKGNTYNKKEDEDINTPLDGEALIREIGGDVLTSELYDTAQGAGFKDRNDLRDLLSSVKGAAVFMNHTPKEQL